MAGLKAVDRRSYGDLRESTFTATYRNKKPLLITGFFDDLPPDHNIRSLWTDEYLCAKLGNEDGTSKSYQVFVAKDNQHFLDQPEVVEKIPMTFDALTTALQAADERATSYGMVYVEYASLTCTAGPVRLYLRDILFLELQADIPYPSKLLWEEQTQGKVKGFSRRLLMLWMGMRGCITSLHYDRCHGFLVQVRGKKRIHLFSPRQTQYLYPHPAATPRSHLSRVVLTELDSPSRRASALAHFPLVARAKRRVTELMPGEILYIPPGYWHEVETLENSISVTIPWDLHADEQPPAHMYS